MFEENLALLRTRHKNVQRYRQLLESSLTDFEREYIGKRLLEEQLAIETLSANAPSEATSPWSMRGVAGLSYLRTSHTQRLDFFFTVFFFGTGFRNVLAVDCFFAGVLVLRFGLANTSMSFILKSA